MTLSRTTAVRVRSRARVARSRRKSCVLCTPYSGLDLFQGWLKYALAIHSSSVVLPGFHLIIIRLGNYRLLLLLPERRSVPFT